MNEQIKKFIELATDESGLNPNTFAELLVNDCIETVKNTPKHCAFTTFQIDLVECTIAKSVEALEERYKNG